jgi:Zn-dependent peptidase ImmA (M78 family)/DNA-binding Xre family transcriptional regulator
MKVNPKMIAIARESRGLSQTELASKLDISISNVSRYEDSSEIKEDTIQKLSEVLDYPFSFFYQDFLVQPPNIHYRKRLTLSPKIIRKADALMNIYRSNIEKMLNTIDLDSANLPMLTESNYDKPRKIAAYLRSYWKVEKGPIKDLVGLVEKHGIMVIMFDFETDKIDGRSMMTESGQPVIFLNKHLAGERIRLTLAHELGHITMHLRTFATHRRDEEAEAFEFASEFLMPESEIRLSLAGKVTLEKLADLKRIWKQSMASILYWSEKLKCVTPNQSRYLWAQFSALGYRKQEPISIQIDTPTLVARMVMLYSKNKNEDLEIGYKNVAEIFHLTEAEFKSRYISPVFKLRVA